MNSDDLDQSLRQHLGGSAPEEVHRRMDIHFRDLAASLQAKAQARQARRPRPWVWIWASLSLAGTFSLAALLIAMVFVPAPTWAQVAERFRSLRFFNATVFFTESNGLPPEKIDLWVAQDHRLRAHYRGLIFFGSEGRITRVIAANDGSDVPLEEITARLRSRTNANDPYPALSLVREIARLGELRDFSLENLLRLFSSTREELQLTQNTDSVLADDMHVFDFATRKKSEWVRLWVLKKSELPVRLRVWDPADGGQTDLVFDYATQMPESAFDPAQVQATLRQKQGATNRLYALLPDSGGRPLTPEQLFSSQGYHLPEIDTVGRTPEGVVWVLSRNVENRRADGERVFGWSRLTDDLGQSYTHRVIGWVAEEDTLLEYFVPDDLDGHFKTPRSYALTCTDRVSPAPGAKELADEIIGTVTVNVWRETTSIPDLLRAQQNQVAGRTNWLLMALDEAAAQQKWEEFDTTAARIVGEPETDPIALSRDVKRVHRLMMSRDRDGALRLCRRLYPLVRNGVSEGHALHSDIIRWHIAGLYSAGQKEEARTLANQHAAEAVKRAGPEGPQFVVDLLMDLRLSGLPEADIATFFNPGVASLPSVRRRFEGLRFTPQAPSSPQS